MQLSLVVADGKHAGRSVRVKGSKFIIGRSPDCDLRANSRQISRKHCVIRVKNQRVTIRDLASRNGTLVNDEKIEAEHPLANGDRITLGRFEFEVRIIHKTKPAPDSSCKRAKESQAAAEEAGISGIALSIMETFVNSPDGDDDDDFELVGSSAKPQKYDPKSNESTQTFTLPKDESSANEPEESAEDEKTSDGKDPREHVTSEAEKEKARREGAIVGIAKSAQAKRTTATSHEAAAEALRRLHR